MSLRRVLIFAVILIGLLAYIRFVELPQEQGKMTAQQPYRGLSPQAFQEITIRRGDESFRFINNDVVAGGDITPTPDAVAAASVDRSKSWRLADVGAGGLDKGAINSVLNSIVALNLGAPLPQAELESDRGVYGLADPTVVVTVRRGEEAREFRFGLLNQYVSKRYVGVGEEVFLVPDGLFTAVDKGRDQFRNRNPIDFTESEIAAVTLTKKGQEIALVSDESYRWSMKRPEEFKVSDAAMANLGRGLRNLRVADFVDTPESLEHYGLQDPKLRVKLEFRESVRPEPLIIEIGSSKSGVDTFMRVGGIDGVMRLPSDPTETLVKPPAEFRDRSIFRYAVDRVEAVTIERADHETLQLERRGEDWFVNGLPGDRPFVEQVVRSLSSLEADSFVQSGAQAGFESPTARISLKISSDEPKKDAATETLVVGARIMDGSRETGYYGGVNDLKETFILSASTYKLLTPLKESLVKLSSGEAPPVVPASEASAAPIP